MRVLIGCEESGKVRDYFLAMGHDAWSCDLQPSRRHSHRHLVADVRDIIRDQHWDLYIGFPPCTDLAVSGARWFEQKAIQDDWKFQAAKDFFMFNINAPVNRIAVENPIGVMSTLYREPDQIIQPWQFGHGETKATCLWLKKLPLLTPTHQVPGRRHTIHEMHISTERSKLRSETFDGVAEAMALQWGILSPI